MILGALKRHLVQKTVQNFESLVAEPVPGAAVVANDVKANLLHALQSLFKKVKGIVHPHELLKRATEKLHLEMASLDSASKEIQLLDCSKGWSSDGEEPTLKLKDALTQCEGTPLSSRAQTAVESLFNDVLKTICTAPESAFLKEANNFKFNALELIAPHMLSGFPLS